jgi:hypothetical protein
MLCPDSRRVFVHVTLPVVALAAGLEQDDAVLVKIPSKLKPLGIESVKTTLSLPSGPRFFT